MPLEGIRNLKWRWFPELEPALNAAFDRIGFSEGVSAGQDLGYVDSVIETAKRGFIAPKSKVIKDGVWGMVEFDWRTIRLLDSPPVQRLRCIKQLGFSYLTYPSAEHSRFIHSLGMYCVITRFLEAMRKRRDEVAEGEFRADRPDDELSTDLLHAAILHDVGHVPFSHVLENILEGYPNDFSCGPKSVEEFKFDVEECLEKNLKLSECLSLAVVLSPRFQRFYTEVVRPGPGDPDALLRLASLIAGQPIRPDHRGASDLISGTPVDADKIDYVIRDAAACGIPVGIDVARLFLRSAFLQVPRDVLAGLLPTGRSGLTEFQTIFVLNASGVDTIEELAQARAALYQRVYLHQTTRNAERLLGRCFEQLLSPGDTVAEPTDAFNLWSMDDFTLLRKLADHKMVQVRAVGRRLRNRELPKRACVFGRSMVAPVIPIKDLFPNLPAPSHVRIVRQTVGAALEPLRRGRLPAEMQAKLEVDIAEETKRLVQAVRPSVPDIVPDTDEPPIVAFLPMPDLEEERKDCFVLENRELVHSSSRSVSDEQSDAADIFKSLGYILTDSTWRIPVFLAARTILYNRVIPLREISFSSYGEDGAPVHNVKSIGRVSLEFRTAVRRAGLELQRVLSLQKAAEDVGYFDDQPQLAREPTDHRVEAIAERLAQFCGQGDWHVSSASCRAFLSQFPPRLREDALTALSHIHVLDRTTIAACLARTIKKLDIKTKGRFICALSPDSGQFVRMILQQELKEELGGDGWSFEKSIQDVCRVAKPGDYLVLCDDNTTSGSQAECQLMAWFGVPRDQWAPDQQQESGISEVALDERDLDVLKKMHVVVAACAGSKQAERRLCRRAEQLGIKHFAGVRFEQTIKPHAVQLAPPLKKFLAEVGAHLLAYCRYAESRGPGFLDDEKRKACYEDALGYGNAEGILTTIFNVPVSTITALWCPGIFKQRPWMPLLLRRGYLQHLVLS